MNSGGVYLAAEEQHLRKFVNIEVYNFRLLAIIFGKMNGISGESRISQQIAE